MGLCPCGVWYPVWSSWWQWWLTRAPRALDGSRSSSWLHLESRMTVTKQPLQSRGELQTLHRPYQRTNWLGSVAQLQWPSVRISQCSSRCKLVATLSFKALRFPISQLISLLLGVLPRLQETFLFHSSLPSVQVPSWFLFFFSFVLPRYREILLPFQMSEILCQRSVDILWESFHM